jgi:hypothetical protein
MEEVKMKVLLHMESLFNFGIIAGDNATLPWPQQLNV